MCKAEQQLFQLYCLNAFIHHCYVNLISDLIASCCMLNSLKLDVSSAVLENGYILCRADTYIGRANTNHESG